MVADAVSSAFGASLKWTQEELQFFCIPNLASFFLPQISPWNVFATVGDWMSHLWIYGCKSLMKRVSWCSRLWPMPAGACSEDDEALQGLNWNLKEMKKKKNPTHPCTGTHSPLHVTEKNKLSWATVIDTFPHSMQIVWLFMHMQSQCMSLSLCIIHELTACYIFNNWTAKHPT